MTLLNQRTAAMSQHSGWPTDSSNDSLCFNKTQTKTVKMSLPLLWLGSAGTHGLFLGDANRGAQRQAGTAGRDVWLVVEGAEHLGRGEAGGGGGPQPGGPAQPHTLGPGPAATGGELEEAGGVAGHGGGGGRRRSGDERRQRSVSWCGLLVLWFGGRQEDPNWFWGLEDFGLILSW